MDSIESVIYGTGIVPVVVLNNAQSAVALATAFLENSINVMEITFRTKAAIDAVRIIAETVPGMVVGAGTILNIEMAEAAMDAGAKFIVCPGYDDAVVRCCRRRKVPVFPGVSTASEIQKAIGEGLDTLKFFPAEQSGGIGILKSFNSPFKAVRFMPTGGINDSNIDEYCKLENVIACGGSWICPPKLIDEGRFGEISALCREAVAKVHGFTLCHIGINSNDVVNAGNIAKQYSSMLRMPIKETGNSLFVGDALEIMKVPFLGENGHIAIGVNNIKRSIKYFELQGYEFTDVGYVDGACAYFKELFGGFAVHLKQL